MVSAGSTMIFAAGMGSHSSDLANVVCVDRSGANNCLEIAALGTRAAYNKLWFKSHLLVLVGDFAVSRLNLLEEQLGRPVANSQPGLTNRGQWYGSRRRKCNVVIADNCHVVRHPQSSSHKTLQHTDRQEVIRREYRGWPVRAGHGDYLFRGSDACINVQMRCGDNQKLR
jgi:hypothetical protein